MSSSQLKEITLLRTQFSQRDFDRFAAVSGDDNPIHVDPEFSARTRFGQTVAHGMMLYGFISGVIGSKFPGPGVLQYRQDMMFQYPTFTEVEVRIKMGVVEADETQATLSTNIYLPEDNRACVGEARVILPNTLNRFPGVDPAMSPQFESEAKRHKGMEIGQSIEITRSYSAADIAEYADLTGDRNPIYLDEKFARSIGFRGTLIPAPLMSGIFSWILGTKLPGRGTNWMKQSVHIAAPAYIDEPLTTRMEIVRLRPDKDLVNLNGTIRNEAGEIVSQCTSLVLVKDLEEV
jgi:acyl dehydratase